MTYKEDKDPLTEKSKRHRVAATYSILGLSKSRISDTFAQEEEAEKESAKPKTPLKKREKRVWERVSSIVHRGTTFKSGDAVKLKNDMNRTPFYQVGAEGKILGLWVSDKGEYEANVRFPSGKMIMLDPSEIKLIGE